MNLQDGYVHLVETCNSLAMARAIHACISRCRSLNQSAFVSSKIISMYGRCGSVADAKRVLDSFCKESLCCWASMISVYIQHHHLQHAQHLLRFVPKQAAFFPWTSLLAAYARNGYFDEAKNLFDTMPRKDIVSFTLMMIAYAEIGLIDHARLLFDRVPQRDLILWTTMLTAYSSNMILDEALQIFNEMPEHNVVCCSAVLVVYSQIGDIDSSIVLFDELPQRDLVTWTSMITAYSIRGDLPNSRRVFAAMPERNLVSWNAILAAAAHNGCCLENVKMVFEEMPQCNVVSWNELLAAFVKDGHLDEARSVFQMMPQLNIISWNTMLFAYASNRCVDETRSLFASLPVRDIASWTIMLYAYCQQGQLVKASRIHGRMPDRDAASATTLLVGLVNSSEHGSCDRALDVFHSVVLDGGRPSGMCFAAVLSLCNHRGGLYRARCLFGSMSVDYRMQAVKQHYCCVVDLLARAGYLHESLELIGSMPFEPDLYEWACLLGRSDLHQACYAVNSSRGEFLLSNMRNSTRAGFTVLLNVGIPICLWNSCEETTSDHIKRRPEHTKR